MSFGKMSSFIKIISNKPVKDSEGFVTNSDVTLASVRAYREDKHGSEAWKNQAVFSTATTLFRFRKIPGVTVTTDMFILCDGDKYNIVNVEDVKGRGMYIETLAERASASSAG
jgi:SPP1 family predicted phage head-tail adaptor